MDRSGSVSRNNNKGKSYVKPKAKRSRLSSLGGTEPVKKKGATASNPIVIEEPTEKLEKTIEICYEEEEEENDSDCLIIAVKSKALKVEPSDVSRNGEGSNSSYELESRFKKGEADGFDSNKEATDDENDVCSSGSSSSAESDSSSSSDEGSISI